MEGSCGCIKYAVVYSREGVILQIGGWAGLTAPHCSKERFTKRYTGPRAEYSIQ